MTKKLVELAIRGCKLETVAANIAAMNPSIYVAERIVSGFPDIYLEKLQAHLQKSWKNARLITTDFENGFTDECLNVEFEYEKDYWFNKDTQIEIDENGFLKNTEILRKEGSSYEHDGYTIHAKAIIKINTHMIPELFAK